MVKRGTEYIDPAMNWGTTLTLLGAIRVEGDCDREWGSLWPGLRPTCSRSSGAGTLVMDNLRAHHNPRVAPACRAHGVRVLYLSDLDRSGFVPSARHTRCVGSHAARAVDAVPSGFRPHHVR